MSLLSISQISNLTGHSRLHVTRSLAEIPFTPGDKNAKLFKSSDVLTLRLNERGEANNTEAQSRLQLNEAKCRVLKIQEETLQRTRIPIEDIKVVDERLFGSLVGIIKSRHERIMTTDAINDLLQAMRDAAEEIHTLCQQDILKHVAIEPFTPKTAKKRRTASKIKPPVKRRRAPLPSKAKARAWQRPSPN